MAKNPPWLRALRASLSLPRIGPTRRDRSNIAVARFFGHATPDRAGARPYRVQCRVARCDIDIPAHISHPLSRLFACFAGRKKKKGSHGPRWSRSNFGEARLKTPASSDLIMAKNPPWPPCEPLSLLASCADQSQNSQGKRDTPMLSSRVLKPFQSFQKNVRRQ